MFPRFSKLLTDLSNTFAKSLYLSKLMIKKGQQLTINLLSTTIYFFSCTETLTLITVNTLQFILHRVEIYFNHLPPNKARNVTRIQDIRKHERKIEDNKRAWKLIF